MLEIEAKLSEIKREQQKMVHDLAGYLPKEDVSEGKDAINTENQMPPIQEIKMASLDY